jgi:hypothetical protein
MFCLQEKQQRSRARLSRVERGDGSQWLSSSRSRADMDAFPCQGQPINSEDSAQTISNEVRSVGAASSTHELGGANSNLRSTRGQPKKILPPADSDQASVNTGGKVKAVGAGGDHKKVIKAALTLQPWTEGDGGRVPVWDTRSQRILWGNCAPLAKNIEKYLENHPTMKIWAGEGRQRFAVDEGVIGEPIMDSTSVEFQAREFLGSDDGEDSSISLPASPIRGAQAGDSRLHNYPEDTELRSEEPDADCRPNSGIVNPLAEDLLSGCCDPSQALVYCDPVAVQSARFSDAVEEIAGQVQGSSINRTDASISGIKDPLLPVAVSLAESQVTVPIPAEFVCAACISETVTIANDGVSQPQSSKPSLILSSVPLETFDTTGCLNTEPAQKTPPTFSFPDLCVSVSDAETFMEAHAFAQEVAASRSANEEVQSNDSAGTVSRGDPFALSNVGYTEGPVECSLQVPAEETSSI